MDVDEIQVDSDDSPMAKDNDSAMSETSDVEVEDSDDDAEMRDSTDGDINIDSKPKVRKAEGVKQRKAAKANQKSTFDKQRKELNSTREADTLRRYKYLIGQTEVFAHFLNLKTKGIGLEPSEAKAKASSKASSKSTDASHRHRKTEKEEDEELLQGDDEDVMQVVSVFEESPAFIQGGIMRDYQLQGLNWLISLYENGINGILADEMGLGKTLQTISLLGYLKTIHGVEGPHLVVVPKTTLHNWMSEFKKWCPEIDAFMFHGDKEGRAALVQDTLLPGKFGVCVTSYEMCLREKTHLKKFSWQYIIIDEAHRIKNENSLLSQIVREFPSRNRLLITGTPLQNNLHELWALLNFLLPDVFEKSADFDAWFAKQGADQDKVVAQLHKVLRPFLLRRIKADVEKSLLPKKRINLYVGMSSMQRRWYQKILEKDIDAVNGATGRGSKTRLQNIVMQLRKCCNHPYLFDGAEPGPPYTTDQHIVDNSGKMAILDKLLARMKSKGSRVLIFSQMSRVLDILEDYCFWRGYQYCRIDGQTAHEDRIRMIDDYNAEGSEKFIFLLTTRAGGLGINLATADTVVMYDNDWNPQVDLQAEDRAHRIGQKKQVVVFRFITENTIDEKVIEKATQKLRLDQLVIQQGRATVKPGMTNEDLLSMIQHGAESIFKSADSTIGNDDIEEILKRGEEKTAELEGKYKDMGLDDLQKFTMEAKTMEWEGEDYGKRNAVINKTWIAPSKRQARAKEYDVDGYFRRTLETGGKRHMPNRPKTATSKVEDYKFFPREMEDLQEKETLFAQKTQGFKVLRRTPDEGEVITEEELEKEREEEQAKVDEAEDLTDEEKVQLAELKSQAFNDWNRRDFQLFTKANEKYGRKNLEAIARDIEGKTLEQVTAYAKTFWERCEELIEWERIKGNIEKGEGKIQKTIEVQQALRDKVASYREPLLQMKLQYGTSKGKNFNEEEDRFLVVMLERFGYGTDDAYEKIKQELKKSPMFRFDWFVKSRTVAEVQRRCGSLITMIQKELDEPNKAGGDASAPAGPTATAGEEEVKEEKKDTKGKRKAKEPAAPLPDVATTATKKRKKA
ncbi:hypothetical protein SmJEL517_g04395 [Synchytrium microbalum]|uniref:Uncharacterized protein n=1 Tax=Synchytrium microbalum TaxID=1806994 RepID=A0A507C536_9FUNG|nr:uncharacterized protein SmJEL517_g04395 [Synchytrium microbalum]TPX32545.1 hypothetical protein SmJEL517_g04395 [Synchytrium microbalum]